MNDLRLVAGLLALATGCGNGGSAGPGAAGGSSGAGGLGGAGGAGGSGGGSPPVVVTGAVEGCVEEQGGSVRFVQSAADVMGAPVVGATVTAAGVSVSAATGEDGCFRLDGVPAGLSSLEVDGAAPVALTIIGEATVNVGLTAVSHSEAILEAEQALSDRGYPSIRGMWILATQQPLPTGVTVDDALDRLGVDEATPSLVTVSNPSWFVYVDPFPRNYFTHPTLFVLVDASTGEASSFDVTSWPHLNGLVYYASEATNASSPDAVTTPPIDTAPALRPALATALKGGGGNLLGLVIQGDGREDFQIDGESWTNAIQNAGGSTQVYTPPTEAQETVIDGPRDILGLFEVLNEEARPEDKLVIAFSTHGKPDGTMTIEQGFPGDGAQPVKVAYTIDQIPWDTVKADNIVIVIDTCHAEAVAEPLEMLFKGEAFEGKKIAVLSGTCANEVGGGQNRNADPGFSPGGYVTNAVLEQLAGDFCPETLVAKFNDIAGQANSTSKDAMHIADWTLASTTEDKGIGVNPKLLPFNIPGDCSDTEEKVSSASGVGDNLGLDVPGNVDYRVSIAPTVGSSPNMGTMTPLGSALTCGQAAFATTFGPDITGPRFNDSTYPCGVGEEALTLCQNTSPIPDGDYIVVFNVLAEDVVLDDPSNFWIYGFVFDADDDPSNNFVPVPQFPDDFFQDTDRWYQAQYTPGVGWSLRVTDATVDPGGSVQSQARLIIIDNTLALVVPRSEFSVDRPKYRLTNFRHAGDFGQIPPPNWDGDVQPAVKDGLTSW